MQKGYVDRSCRDADVVTGNYNDRNNDHIVRRVAGLHAAVIELMSSTPSLQERGTAIVTLLRVAAPHTPPPNVNCSAEEQQELSSKVSILFGLFGSCPSRISETVRACFGAAESVTVSNQGDFIGRAGLLALVKGQSISTEAANVLTYLAQLLLPLCNDDSISAHFIAERLSCALQLLSQRNDVSADCLAKIDWLAAGLTSSTAPATSIKDTCCVCFSDSYGTYHRTGFKCARCFGVPSTHDRVESSDAYMVNDRSSDAPEDVNEREFSFSDHEDEAAEAVRILSSNPLWLGESPSLSTSISRTGSYLVSFVPQNMQQVFVDHQSFVALCHPNVLHLFAACPGDTKCGKGTWYVHENLPQLAVAAHFIMGRAAGREQIVEEFKAVIYSLLRALCTLHERGFAHGDLRPQNFFVDPTKELVKLRFAPKKVKLPSPFCPPEDENTLSEDYSPSLAGDIFALGVALRLVVFGAPSEETLMHASDVSGDEKVLLHFLHRMTDPDPRLRPTCWDLMTDPVLGTVRIVHGVPVACRTSLIECASGPRALKALDTATFLPSRGMRFDAGEAGRKFYEFLDKKGKEFQVIQKGTSLTLYSVRSDPRQRQRNQPM